MYLRFALMRWSPSRMCRATVTPDRRTHSIVAMNSWVGKGIRAEPILRHQEPAANRFSIVARPFTTAVWLTCALNASA